VLRLPLDGAQDGREKRGKWGDQPAGATVEKQSRGGGRLEEGERPDKRARPVSRSERWKGKCGPAAVFGPKERSWAA
jgi:hypothetical protein